MRVVVDTNVIVSGLLKAGTPPAMVLNLVISETIRMLVNEAVLSEYETVLGRSKFGFDPEAIADFMSFIRHESEHIVTTPAAKTTTDPDDQVFYDIAITGHAEYLITGNIAHFPDEKWIMTPRQFVEIVREKAEGS
ncbi:MAG: putative toxin-antitoxin system toxin component, PIN family [Spirochaeta sp.]|jgi:putative PIN family toxin of toxin-antitoxin system|nr:putative toxin-antitoxin system toxin component, PIN family [Spirochaeta sp.]